MPPPNVFTIATERPFLETLARGLVTLAGDDPQLVRPLLIDARAEREELPLAGARQVFLPRGLGPAVVELARQRERAGIAGTGLMRRALGLEHQRRGGRRRIEPGG